MARKSTRAAKSQQPDGLPVQDYRYRSKKRKNNPPAGLAAQGQVRETPKIHFAYNPHLPPVLRFDATGESDKLPELLQAARTRPLSEDEARLLAAALGQREPWLEWAGKREEKGFVVDPVALHIHERVATQAILKVAARQDVQRSLFGDPEQDYREAVQFYQHDVDWSNRLILGDSLQVMASLARREDVAGKVQMIYMDPPYGIRFASNFQPEVGKRDVKDREADLTREPEMVKAYRDTWTLGVHSYLAYLRDRLYLCKELLADTGSIFVQIGDENVHLVREVMDEVFHPDNCVVTICFKKKAYQDASSLAPVSDYILWYAKDKRQLKPKPLYVENIFDGDVGKYSKIESPTGALDSSLNLDEREINARRPSGWRLVRDDYPVVSQDPAPHRQPFGFQSVTYEPTPGRHWSEQYPDGMNRLAKAERLRGTGRRLYGVVYWADSPIVPLSNFWERMKGAADPIYVVQTTEMAVQRCLLMTTDPGDLVLDPTCGSGTTAYVAEQWGRRWITIDTSRVAIALARQRLLTATFPFYKVKNGEANGEANPAKGFDYKTVPRITLKSIAQNVALDSIFKKHLPALDEKLAALNTALKLVTPELRKRHQQKLMEKEQREGKRAVTDADRRRWQLPKTEWKEWEVPFDTDDDWPPALRAALTDYRTAWRAKMDEVNACIESSAEPEELVDQPDKVSGVVRVSGPFTVEAVMPAEESLDGNTPIGGEPEELDTFSDTSTEPINAEAYLDKMLRLLRGDGVRFPDNKVMKFTRLDPFSGDYLHAEGKWQNEESETRSVAVSFGPQFGPVTAYQVEHALPSASRRGSDDLVFAGFSFDGAAQAIIQDDPNPRVRCHLAHIRPDVNMGGLLKETPNSQLFTVFGTPRTELRETEDGQHVIAMQGVDIYNPVENTILPTSADKVAAWFLDTDYDGRTFCVCQAFFPDKSAWEKLARALRGVIDEDRFDALTGTESLPFAAGEHKRAAVKVIDPRGNEVMRVVRLG